MRVAVVQTLQAKLEKVEKWVYSKGGLQYLMWAVLWLIERRRLPRTTFDLNRVRFGTLISASSVAQERI